MKIITPPAQCELGKFTRENQKNETPKEKRKKIFDKYVKRTYVNKHKEKNSQNSKSQSDKNFKSDQINIII